VWSTKRGEILAKSHEEWDRDESFVIKLLNVILYKLGWIGYPLDEWEINIHWT